MATSHLLPSLLTWGQEMYLASGTSGKSNLWIRSLPPLRSETIGERTQLQAISLGQLSWRGLIALFIFMFSNIPVNPCICSLYLITTTRDVHGQSTAFAEEPVSKETMLWSKLATVIWTVTPTTSEVNKRKLSLRLSEECMQYLGAKRPRRLCFVSVQTSCFCT